MSDEIEVAEDATTSNSSLGSQEILEESDNEAPRNQTVFDETPESWLERFYSIYKGKIKSTKAHKNETNDVENIPFSPLTKTEKLNKIKNESVPSCDREKEITLVFKSGNKSEKVDKKEESENEINFLQITKSEKIIEFKNNTATPTATDVLMKRPSDEDMELPNHTDKLEDGKANSMVIDEVMTAILEDDYVVNDDIYGTDDKDSFGLPNSDLRTMEFYNNLNKPNQVNFVKPSKFESKQKYRKQLEDMFQHQTLDTNFQVEAFKNDFKLELSDPRLEIQTMMRNILRSTENNRTHENMKNRTARLIQFRKFVSPVAKSTAEQADLDGKNWVPNIFWSF